MFIKSITIPNKKKDKHYAYYRLCESYRVGDAPRHRTILNLGKLEKLPDRTDHKLLADKIEQLVYKRQVSKQQVLFEDTNSPAIDSLARHFASIIINKKLVDVSHKKNDNTEAKNKTFYAPVNFQSIDIGSVEHGDVRESGAEWLCQQTLDRLDLSRYLKKLGWEERWIKIAMIYLIGRAVFPASDLKTQDWLEKSTMLNELYNMDFHKVNRHHLYKVSRMLYNDKKKIEAYLSSRTNELFNVEDKIILYDLTNTYFEGQKNSSKKSRRGRSKEKRSDAKLMALAMVVNAEGFVKYSKIYEGNMSDSKTLKQTIEDIPTSISASHSKKVIVMDAGISTEDNLKMLRQEKYDYVCVSLSKIKEYQAVRSDKEMVKLSDKKGNTISVQWVKTKEGKEEDNILYVKSNKKQLKEESMESHFCKRYEEGLVAIEKGIEKKCGVKKCSKVYERIGRLKEKYPSVHRYYQIKIIEDKGIVTKIVWEKINDGKNKQGIYFVRTTLETKDEETVWKIYNTIREIESTFRVLKSDLQMRPVFHQEDIYSESHIYGSILAYTIVHSIRYPLKNKGIHLDWSNIVRKMNTQKVVTTIMKTEDRGTLYLKKCSEPNAEVKEIYHALGYKDRPFWVKRSVLPKNENPKSQLIDTT